MPERATSRRRISRGFSQRRDGSRGRLALSSPGTVLLATRIAFLFERSAVGRLVMPLARAAGAAAALGGPLAAACQRPGSGCPPIRRGGPDPRHVRARSLARPASPPARPGGPPSALARTPGKASHTFGCAQPPLRPRAPDTPLGPATTRARRAGPPTRPCQTPSAARRTPGNGFEGRTAPRCHPEAEGRRTPRVTSSRSRVRSFGRCAPSG
jgi:hypothetical protein